MNISVRGTIPGNDFDAGPYIVISQEEDTFTSSDVYEFRRSMTVSIDGAGQRVLQPALLRWEADVHARAIALALTITPPASKRQASHLVHASLPGRGRGEACQTCQSRASMHTCARGPERGNGRACCTAGLNATSYQPGNMLRFQLLFRLTSSLDPNYLHIHRVKGIIQASTVRTCAFSKCLCMAALTFYAVAKSTRCACDECALKVRKDSGRRLS